MSEMRMSLDAKAFKKDLSKLDAVVVDQIAGNALESAASIFENAWKDKAPVKTGTYRRSIHQEKRGSGLKQEVVVGTDITTPPYPIYLEYGTRRMNPRPSARPAWDESKDRLEGELKRVLKIGIENATK